jgi:peptide/nickel transport system substrate-binding protein
VQETRTFAIAEGAKFHDSSPVTAEDVVFSLQRLRNTPSGVTRRPGAPGVRCPLALPRAATTSR